MTDDSAFKKQVRARMADTGEKYTVARRHVLAEHGAVVLRVALRPQVDLELTRAAARAYAAADERGRREIAGRLLAERIEAAVAGSTIGTEEELHAEAEDAAIQGVVRRSVDRLVGVSAVTVDRTADRLLVSVRAARPIVLVGPRGDDADRLRGELEELTGRRVGLEILEARDPQE